MNHNLFDCWQNYSVDFATMFMPKIVRNYNTEKKSEISRNLQR